MRITEGRIRKAEWSTPVTMLVQPKTLYLCVFFTFIEEALRHHLTRSRKGESKKRRRKKRRKEKKEKARKGESKKEEKKRRKQEKEKATKGESNKRRKQEKEKTRKEESKKRRKQEKENGRKGEWNKRRMEEKKKRNVMLKTLLPSRCINRSLGRKVIQELLKYTSKIGGSLVVTPLSDYPSFGGPQELFKEV